MRAIDKVAGECKGSNTFHKFWLLQTKDQCCKKNNIFGLSQLFYVLEYERFDDGHHAGLETKDHLI